LWGGGGGEMWESRLERVIGFHQLELGGPATEQLSEKVLEVLVDLFEGGQQALARLAVEALDAKPQFLDCFHKIVALGRERRVLSLDLSQFFFCSKIDGSEAFPLAAQTLEFFFDLGEIRE